MATQAKAGQTTSSFDSKLIFPSSDYRDKIAVEVLSRKLENYAPAVYGTPHPDTTLFPSHRLVLQVEQSPEEVVRYYAADRSDEDPYNASISYSGDSKDHPIFIRDYIVRRTAYAAITRLTALSGLVDSDVTAGGTGYTQETTTASLAGGTGSGGVVTPIVSNGVVIGLVITTQGSYSVAPTVTINSTGSGVGATGTVAVQLQTATLVKEDMLAKTGDERIDSLYVLVRRIYETLPGPWLYEIRENELLGLIQLKKRAVAVTTPPQVGSVTATGKTVYQAREDSSVVAWEIVETYSDGTGSVGNPAYPIVPRSPWNDERGTITGTEQLVVKTTPAQSSTLTESGGTVTLKTYEPYNQFLMKEVIETWATTGPYRNGADRDDKRGAVKTKRRLVINSEQTPTLVESPAGTMVLTNYEPFSKVQSWEVIETWALPALSLTSTTIDKDGMVILETRVQSLTSAITSAHTFGGGTETWITKEAITDIISWKVTKTRAAPGTPISESAPDFDGIEKTTVRTYVDLSTVTTTEVATGGFWQRYSKEAVNELMGWKVSVLRAIPGNLKDEITFPYGTVGRRIVSKTLIERASYTSRTANGTPHPVTTTALLTDERLDDHPDSLVVAFRVRTYDEIPTAANQQGLGYFVSYDESDAAFPHLTWRYKATRISATFPAFGSACPISGYTSLVLSEIPPTQPVNDADFQVVVTLKYEILPGSVVPDKPRVMEDGAVVSVTRQRVVNGTVTAGLTTGSGTIIATTEEAVSKYVSSKIITTTTYVASLIDRLRSEEVRGENVIITRTKAGGQTPDSGNLVISSKVTALSTALDEKVTATVANLPADEAWAYWDFVSIPLQIFDIVHAVICNTLPGVKVTTTPDKAGGASALRKHRATVSYSNTYPNPDLSASAFEMAAIEYHGKVIDFSFSNILNDELIYSGEANDGTCTWDEEYSFVASTPSATTFAAGAWYVRNYLVEPWGTSGFKATKIEFYSIKSNPSI